MHFNVFTQAQIYNTVTFNDKLHLRFLTAFVDFCVKGAFFLLLLCQ